MTTLENVQFQIADAKNEFYNLVDAWHVHNLDIDMDESVILGPYARSTAYKENSRTKLVTKVLKFHDVIDKYYIIEVYTSHGKSIYNQLKALRSTISRLEKELNKK